MAATPISGDLAAAAEKPSFSEITSVAPLTVRSPERMPANAPLLVILLENRHDAPRKGHEADDEGNVLRGENKRARYEGKAQASGEQHLSLGGKRLFTHRGDQVDRDGRGRGQNDCLKRRHGRREKQDQDHGEQDHAQRAAAQNLHEHGGDDGVNTALGKLAVKDQPRGTSDQISTAADDQAEYGREVEATFGVASRWNPANKVALQSLPYSQEELDVINAQWEHLDETPGTMGDYYTSRYLVTALNQTVMQGLSGRIALEDAVKEINKEMRRKQAEFGIPKDGAIYIDRAAAK